MALQFGKKLEKQIPHRLNFTPTSAKAALVGGPRCVGFGITRIKGFIRRS
jgi:hypothetical protein